jgi:hypothetical protein
MVIPVSLIAIEAPDEDFRRIPPVGPGTSLIMRVLWPTDWITITCTPGGAARARGGTSAEEPQKHPDQMG